MKTNEYNEGPEALERFNRLAMKLFRAPKAVAKKPAKPERKPKEKPSKD